MITVLEAASLSYDVYEEPSRPPLPEGWSIFNEYKKDPNPDAYYGCCYMKGNINDDDLQICFSHRGTVPSYYSNIKGDIEIFYSEPPMQYYDAKDFFEETLDLLVKKSTNSNAYKFIANSSQVGHSLGAAIAGLIYANYYEKFTIRSQAILFECPGLETIIKNMIKKNELLSTAIATAEWCKIFQTHFNAINTCHGQLGETYSVPVPCNVPTYPPYPVPNLAIENSYYLTTWTLEQHSMLQILQTLENYPSGLQQRFDFWYEGLQGGYQSGYLTYKYEPEIKEYWDIYIQRCWDTYPSIHKKYSNFEDFKYDFMRYTLNEEPGKKIQERSRLSSNSMFKSINNARSNGADLEVVYTALLDDESQTALLDVGTSNHCCTIS